jgi:hypothetical protein
MVSSAEKTISLLSLGKLVMQKLDVVEDQLMEEPVIGVEG